MGLAHVVNTLFCGSLNDEVKLAGAGIAMLTHTAFLYTLSMAVARPLDMYTTQAFGAGDLRLCGIYLNRSYAILTVIFIPVAFMLS